MVVYVLPGSVKQLQSGEFIKKRFNLSFLTFLDHNTWKQNKCRVAYGDIAQSHSFNGFFRLFGRIDEIVERAVEVAYDEMVVWKVMRSVVKVAGPMKSFAMMLMEGSHSCWAQNCFGWVEKEIGEFDDEFVHDDENFEIEMEQHVVEDGDSMMQSMQLHKAHLRYYL